MTQFNLPQCCASCLADEATKSWRIEAETKEVDRDSGNDITRFHWVYVPLCSSCRRHLMLQCWLFALVGIMLGAVGAVVMFHFGPQLLATYRDLSPRFMAVIAIGIPGIVAWGVGYTMRKGLVDAALAIYQPREGRLWFGNKRYQALFEEANWRTPTRPRSTLGV